MKLYRYQLLLVILSAAAILISGCSAASQQPSFGMADLKTMPESVQQAPQTVQDSYRFAVANQDVLTQIPCYCGCGPMGHTSNYSCYVQSSDDDGIVFDEHALGCSICVDITTDTMHMLKEGKSVKEIRGVIDLRYSPFGPSNMEPLTE